MKLKWTQNQTENILSGIAIGSVLMVFYFVLKNLGSIFNGVGNLVAMLTPFIIGLVIAYILYRPMSFFEKKLLRLLKDTKFRGKTLSAKTIRNLAVVTTFMIVILVTYTIMAFLIPQLIFSISTFINQIPAYLASFQKLLDQWGQTEYINKELLKFFGENWNEALTKAAQLVKKAMPSILGVSQSITSAFTSLGMGFIISIYFLVGKEKFILQLKKIFYALLPETWVVEIFRVANLSNQTFSKYIVGQLTDCFILGMACFVLMLILGIPFALMISVIVAFTNIIPILGPFIGGVPSFLLILMVNPVKAVWFAILILVLQQIDGNILVPRIVGSTTGLSGFWVLLALFLGANFWGLTGAVVAVPVMSVLYTLLRELIHWILEKKGIHLTASSSQLAEDESLSSELTKP